MIRQVSIVGEGYAPYFCALYLYHSFKGRLNIRVVERLQERCESIVTITPELRRVHTQLGVAEQSFLLLQTSVPNLAMLIEAEGDAEGFMFCESDYGFFIRSKPFNKLFYEFRKRFPKSSLDDFCLQSVLAKKGKFAPRVNRDNSIYSLADYAFMVGADEYRKLLLSKARSIGVSVDVVDAGPGASEINSGEFVHSNTSPEQITINCGRESVCVQTNCGFLDMSALFGLGGMVWSSKVSGNDDSPCTVLSVTDQTVCKAYPLSRKQQVYTKAQAGAPICLGMLDAPWQGNHINIGQARIQIPSVLVNPLEVLLADLRSLFVFWPNDVSINAVREAFNKASKAKGEQLIDIENMIFYLAGFTEVLTESNRLRLRLFSEVGRIPDYEDDALGSMHWVALFHAFGVYENGIEEDLTEDRPWIADELNKIQKTFSDASDSAPSFKHALNSMMVNRI